MARPIVRFTSGGNISLGGLAWTATRNLDCAGRCCAAGNLCSNDGGFAHGARKRVPEEPACTVVGESFLSPVTTDAQLVCQGLNYRAHAEEAAHAHRRRQPWCSPRRRRRSPVRSIPFCGRRKSNCSTTKWRIGRRHPWYLNRNTQVDADSLGDYVAGVVLCNDVSARDVMFGASFMQWFHGKSFRGFCPCGPVLILLDRDEVVSHARRTSAIELSVEW